MKKETARMPRTRFQEWLREAGACRQGRRWAGNRRPFDVITDPSIPREYLIWYLQKLDLPTDVTALVMGVGFEHLSFRTQLRVLTTRIRLTAHQNLDRVVFVPWHETNPIESPLFDRLAMIPIPLQIYSWSIGNRWGGYAYFLNFDTKKFESRWVK